MPNKCVHVYASRLCSASTRVDPFSFETTVVMPFSLPAREKRIRYITLFDQPLHKHILLILVDEFTGIKARYGRSPGRDASPVRWPIKVINLERLLLPHAVLGQHVDGVILQPELAVQIVMDGIVLLPRANVVRLADFVAALHLLLGGGRRFQHRGVEGPKDNVQLAVSTTLGLLGRILHLLLHFGLLGLGTLFVRKEGWGRRVVMRRRRNRSRKCSSGGGGGGGRCWSSAERARSGPG
mmetsp:Transcript_18892/g.44755  ORF Transcript_18892/g.44755 Transcript_18892/m.44755 type:complete len:239 (-) Transcript_18892:108-824(-)